MTDSLTVNYRFLPDQTLRPYLWVMVTGLNGINQLILGIVDSGADKSCLPLGYISQLGYDAASLTAQPMGQAGGITNSFVASAPCDAVVPGLPNSEFQIRPTFTDGQFVLWGRDDFMHSFDVLFEQSQNRFTLTTH